MEVLSTNEITMFYLRGENGRCTGARLPHTLARLSADIRAGYSYAVIDHFYWPAARFVHVHMQRVARFPATDTTAIGQNLIQMENSHTPYGPYPIPYVDVFRLVPDGLPPPTGKADVCDLNRV
jgi:hypothetical protein